MSSTAPPPPLRVLVLDHTAQEGGAEIALMRLADAARASGRVEVRVLLFAPGPLVERLSAAGIRTVVLPLDERIATTRRDAIGTGGLRTAVGAVRFLPRLVRAIRGSGADLVVANSLKSAVFAAFAAPLAGRRWVWHLHDRLAGDYLPAPVVAAMRAMAVLGPRAIVTNSRATLATLPRAARGKAVIAYPGLPSGAFDRGAEPSGHPVVGIIGRVSPTKGQREFIEAAAVIAAARAEVRFQLVGGVLFGEDDYERELHDRVDALGLADRIEFTGWVRDVPQRMRRMTAVVHASPVPEPFGQVVAEAMAAGVPVVATAAGGVPEILDPDGPPLLGASRTTGTGILVRPGDAPAIVEAVTSILTDPEGARRRADAAWRDAAARLTIDRTFEAVSAAWDRARRSGRSVVR